MIRTLQGYSPAAGRVQRAPLIRGLGWGFIGGLAGTMAMDLLLMGIFLAASQSPLLCFSIVGDTVARFFSMLGVQLTGGVSAGVVTHYVVGPLVGLIFGAALSIFPALRKGTLIKSVIAAVLYVEILSQPLLATTPILLKMTPSETLLWYGGSFGMHLVFGIVLGGIAGNGLRSAPTFGVNQKHAHQLIPFMN
jgi:hypothetical protein